MRSDNLRPGGRFSSMRLPRKPNDNTPNALLSTIQVHGHRLKIGDGMFFVLDEYWPDVVKPKRHTNLQFFQASYPNFRSVPSRMHARFHDAGRLA
jgi:hypothetical protein